LHHVTLDGWSRGRSPLHARDPRAKILALLGFLVVMATTPIRSVIPLAAYGLLLACAVLLARLPLASMLWRAAFVLPFSMLFAVMSLAAGDPARAWSMIAKSYLSALAVLLVVGTTPIAVLLRGFEKLGAPRFLVMVVQFLHRYLFVVSEQAQHMRLAASSRGLDGSVMAWGRRLRAAAGAIAVLFARSYARADGIHRAMLSRGFQGHLPAFEMRRFGWRDAVFAALAWSVPLAVRAVLVEPIVWNR
jgi:cobalt/nickel transport system permease protein